MARKYHPLTRYLSSAAHREQCTVEMSFDDIADLVGGLPPSVAQRHWWANSDHVQASAWLTAGYQVEQVYLDSRRVRFTRRDSAVPIVTRPTDPRRNAPGVPPSGEFLPIGLVDVRVTLAWQSAGPVTLDANGKLSVARLDNTPGLYRLTMNAIAAAARRRVYIGETDNLRRRFIGGYRNPGPTQQTNLRINALLRDHFAHGGAIDLAVSTEATVHLDGEPQALDLTRKASRLLAESAALVHARATDDAEIVNLG